MTNSDHTHDDLIDVALKRAEDGLWRVTSIEELAGTLGLSPAELSPQFADKSDIIAAFIARIDTKVLSGDFDFDDEDTMRDRLFEIMMRRFETLERHRVAILHLCREMLTDPIAGLSLAPSVMNSSKLVLKAAGITASGSFGCLQANGLSAVWLATLRVWLEDNTPDLSRTMAALDKNLRRADCFATELQRLLQFKRAGVREEF